MDYLNEFKWKILLVDGMLIETGGKFREMMDDYVDSCVEIANRYYRNHHEKKDLLEIIDFYIMQYKDEKMLKYYVDEMRFLNCLKSRIEQFS